MLRTKSGGNEPIDMDLVYVRAGRVLAGLTREQAIRLACEGASRQTAAWVRQAFRKDNLRVRCLGRFNLANPERPDLPWPALAFAVATKNPPHDRCVLTLYWSPVGEWAVDDHGEVQRPDGSRGVWVDPRQYAGDLNGPPGLLNGDDAGPKVSPERPDASPVQSPQLPLPYEPTESPPPARTRPRAARKPRARKCIEASPEKAPPPCTTPAPPSPSTMELRVRMLEALARLLG